MNLNFLLQKAITASILAGKQILEIYNNSDFQIEYKQDNSPLTIADKKSNEVIIALLENTNIPILSEEGKEIAFEERKNWEYFWLLDPLDGTKEFIKRNGDFTVNIALINNGKPILGVIFVPVTNELYFSNSEIGAFKFIYNDENPDNSEFIISESKKLPIFGKRRNYVVVGSKSHNNEETQNHVQKIKEIRENVEIISRGSSLKFCMIAEGIADIYPRFGPTMEWDTAAGHAIAVASGATIKIAGTDNDLIYNKQNLLNPDFIVERK